MASPFPRQHILEPCRAVGCNDDIKEAITLSISECPASIASHQTKDDDEVKSEFDSDTKRHSVVSQTFLLPKGFGNNGNTTYSLLVHVDTEALRRYTMPVSAAHPQPTKKRWGSMFNRFGYLRLPSEQLDDEVDQKPSRPTPIWTIIATLGFMSLLAVVVALVFSKAPTHKSSWSEEGYIRYHTPGSNGPKRQSRILYENATEWSRNNPHDNGEWKIRLDDQALIPAAAWDPDEDRYQAWFHDRYEVMSDVVKKRSYIRPSWLGSLDILVPWDDEFHLAHCVVTMKRYWKAKESGTHVCPRDIAYNHIEHCLNWFDGYVFRKDPKLPQMGPAMAWQTKVCY
ncbi:hypothetical protein F66182_3516 [Fusarium sp. NRRL 66182]|nr:hypothetical protein F66182_3516 [Fusarium sp. NRRL 66182]